METFDPLLLKFCISITLKVKPEVSIGLILSLRDKGFYFWHNFSGRRISDGAHLKKTKVILSLLILVNKFSSEKESILLNCKKLDAKGFILLK